MVAIELSLYFDHFTLYVFLWWAFGGMKLITFVAWKAARIEILTMMDARRLGGQAGADTEETAPYYNT